MMIRHKAPLLACVLAAATAGAAAAADLKIVPRKQAQGWQWPTLWAQPVSPSSSSEASSASSAQPSSVSSPSSAPPPQSAASIRQPSGVKSVKSSFPSSFPTEVTGSISWPKSARATLSPATAGISYAHAARAAFAKARAAMDVGVMLLDDAPKNNTAALAAATAGVMSELEALERLPQNQNNDLVKRAMALVQDWHRSGLRIISPPPQGLQDVPFPLTVSARAEAVAEALDQLVGQADAFATARLNRPAPGTPTTSPAN
jgi:hypothetical protein